MTKLHEIFPQEEARAGNSLRKGTFTPDNESFDAIVLIKVHSESLQVLSILHTDNLGLSVSRLVQTSLGCVSVSRCHISHHVA